MSSKEFKKLIENLHDGFFQHGDFDSHEIPSKDYIVILKGYATNNDYQLASSTYLNPPEYKEVREVYIEDMYVVDQDYEEIKLNDKQYEKLEKYIINNSTVEP